MNMKVVGKERVDYPSKKTGEQVLAVKLHCVSDTTNPNFEGMKVEQIYIASRNPMYDQCRSFPVGCEISVMYNSRGWIESVLLCNEKK